MTTQSRRKKGNFLTNLKTYISRQRLGELLVIRGLISPQTLRKALHKQKEQNIPLGQLLIEDGIISQWQLKSTLVKQQVLRFGAAVLLIVASLSMNDRAHAQMVQDVPARISLTTQANSAFTPLEAHPAVFQTVERRSGDLKAFTKWTAMFERFDHELKSGKNNHELQVWRTQLSALKDIVSLKSMAIQVNDLVNEIEYINDSRNWGKSDYWATPIEFLTRGGDCEDFAIAKYTALRALGVPEERLRVAIVQDQVKNIPHAVLIVYTEEGPYILDNQIKTLVNAEYEGRYKPIYSINRSAWWLHSAPETTVIASSAY